MRISKTIFRFAVGFVLLVGVALPQLPPIVPQYWEWRGSVDPLSDGTDPLKVFRTLLEADGLAADVVDEQMEALLRGLVIEEGEFYDGIYEEGPDLLPAPNRLLVEAVERLSGGDALDVGMGQGRNAVFLAQQGWQVTGFDPSAVGLQQARENAAKVGVEIKAVQSGAEYFDYGRERWDSIAIIYPIEKFSVFRVRDALKPGGVVVIEAPHWETKPYRHHYKSNPKVRGHNCDRGLGPQGNSARSSCRAEVGVATPDRDFRVVGPARLHLG